jgi:hypothetical protein
MILVYFLLVLLSIQFGVCCTNPCEQLSGEISTHLVPQLGLGDEIFLHTILFSAYFLLELQKTAGSVLLRSFQQGHAIPLRRVRFSYSGGRNSLRRFRSWRGLPWTLGLRLQEEDPTALIYYRTEFGLNWSILPSGPNC